MSKEEFGGKSAEFWAIYLDITLNDVIYVEIISVYKHISVVFQHISTALQLDSLLLFAPCLY